MKGTDVDRATPADDSRQAQTRGTREKIVRASLDLFAENGYEGTSIEEIGRKANITGPAIYRHFASKEDVLVAAYEYAGRGRFAALDASVGLPPDEALEILLTSFVQFTFEMPQWTKLWLLERGGHFPANFKRATVGLQKRFSKRWEDVVAALRPDLDAKAAREIVHAVWSIMNGTVYFPSTMSANNRAALLTEAARAVVLSTKQSGAIVSGKPIQKPAVARASRGAR